MQVSFVIVLLHPASCNWRLAQVKVPDLHAATESKKLHTLSHEAAHQLTPVTTAGLRPPVWLQRCMLKQQQARMAHTSLQLQSKRLGQTAALLLSQRQRLAMIVVF